MAFGRDLLFFSLRSITYVLMNEIYHETHKQEASYLAIRAINYLCDLSAAVLKCPIVFYIVIYIFQNEDLT